MMKRRIRGGDGSAALKRAADAAGALLFGAALLSATPGTAGDYGAVTENQPGDANVPDAGNVVSGGSDAVMTPRAVYEGAYVYRPGYGAPSAYGRAAVAPGTSVVAAYDGGYANVPDPGNVVNGPGWPIR